MGLLNYIYVLQQLEADFYTQAVSTYYNTISATELTLLTDVRDQEIAHKEFIQKQLGTNAMAAIAPNFSASVFANRTSLYTFAYQLEDLVVAGFNGAAGLFSDSDYILILNKMVTVEARHSAYFHDLITANSFGSNRS